MKERGKNEKPLLRMDIYWNEAKKKEYMAKWQREPSCDRRESEKLKASAVIVAALAE